MCCLVTFKPVDSEKMGCSTVSTTSFVNDVLCIETVQFWYVIRNEPTSCLSEIPQVLTRVPFTSFKSRIVGLISITDWKCSMVS